MKTKLATQGQNLSMISEQSEEEDFNIYDTSNYGLIPGMAKAVNKRKVQNINKPSISIMKPSN